MHKKWPFLVFKYEYRNDVRANLSEWATWNQASADEKEFLAKPYYLSKNGRVLVMERVGTYPEYGPLPKGHDEAIDELFEALGHLAWDADSSCNIGPSGSGPKLYDYADEQSTFYHEESYY